MRWPFPLNASEIFVEWKQDECGLGITAYTDEAGLPYIGLYPLDFEGLPCGQPVYFQRSRLITNILVGLAQMKPVIVFIDADISLRGLDARLCIPASLGGPNLSHLWAHWKQNRLMRR